MEILTYHFQVNQRVSVYRGGKTTDHSCTVCSSGWQCKGFPCATCAIFAVKYKSKWTVFWNDTLHGQGYYYITGKYQTVICIIQRLRYPFLSLRCGQSQNTSRLVSIRRVIQLLVCFLGLSLGHQPMPCRFCLSNQLLTLEHCIINYQLNALGNLLGIYQV